MGFFAGHEDHVVLDHYRNLRKLSSELNQTLIRRIPKKTLTEWAKKLGLLRGKVMMFQNESEMACLFDSCLYAYRPGGKSIMQLHIEQYPPPPDSIEMALIKSMMSSRFSVFSVEEVIKGIGVVLLDVLYQEKLFLIDIGLGSCEVKGMLLAGRVMPIGESHMSTGALIPLWGELQGIVHSIVERLCASRERGRVLISTPGEEAAFAAQVFRAAIRTGALEHIRPSHT